MIHNNLCTSGAESNVFDKRDQDLDPDPKKFGFRD